MLCPYAPLLQVRAHTPLPLLFPELQPTAPLDASPLAPPLALPLELPLAPPLDSLPPTVDAPSTIVTAYAETDRRVQAKASAARHQREYSQRIKRGALGPWSGRATESRAVRFVGAGVVGPSHAAAFHIMSLDRILYFNTIRKKSRFGFLG